MTTQQIPVITLDGPAASGKGTIAERLASALGFHYLDSGALYRIATYAALRDKVALDDEGALTQLTKSLAPRFVDGRVFLNNEDTTTAIRSEEVSAATSRVATVPGVRQGLTALQVKAAQLPGLVADGRDMGTVIFPQATLKVFMTASARVRAERRYKQLIARGEEADLDAITADLVARDERDSHRATAPLKPAEDAKLLDTSEMGIDEVVKKILCWWNEKV